MTIYFQILIEVAKELKLSHHGSGTNVVCVEGPRFSSKAESKMFQLWGGDIINMTAVPEVVLANEAGLCYAAIAMVTDYDCWKDDHEPVGCRLQGWERGCMEGLRGGGGGISRLQQRSYSIIIYGPKAVMLMV